MARRTVLLISALAVAALGTLLVFLYVRGVDDRALDDQNPVEVLVATQRIAAGTSVEDAEAAGAFDIQAIPADAVLTDAVTSTSQIEGDFATTDIYEGEQIIPQRFAPEPEETETGVPADKLAVSVEMSDPNRVAQFLTAGTTVAIFATVGESTRALIPTIEVIAVGDQTLKTTTTTDSQGTQVQQEFSAALVTLAAANQTEAQLIKQADSEGELFMAVLGPGSSVSLDVAATTLPNPAP